VQLDLVSAVSLVTATEKTKAQRESMSDFLSMQEAGVDVAGVIDRYEAEAKVIAVCEVFNASTNQRFRTKLVKEEEEEETLTYIFTYILCCSFSPFPPSSPFY
jgi:hypothetical protein